MAIIKASSIVFAWILIYIHVVLKIRATSITCDTQFLQKQDNTDYVCPKEQCPSGKIVYGTYDYTEDSTVCRAAWHDGRILPWSDNDADRTVRWTTCTSPSAYVQSFRYGAGRTWGYLKTYGCKRFMSSRKVESLYRLSTLSSPGSGTVRLFGGSDVDLTHDVISATVYDNAISTSPPTEMHFSNTEGYKEYRTHGAVNVFTDAGNKKNLYSGIVNINYGDIPLLRADQSSTLRLVSSSFNMTADAWKAIDGNRSTDFMNGQSCSHTLKRSNLQSPWWRVELDGIYTVHGITVTSRNGSHDCKTTQMGRDYMGTFSEHIQGKTCRMWNQSRWPFLPENYCRNPDGEPEGPWCYHLNGGWIYCNVSLCSDLSESLSDFQVRISNTSDTPPATTTDALCKHYTGTISDATTVYIACDRHAIGRYLYIIKNGNSKSETLSLCEMTVKGTPVDTASNTLTTRVSVGDNATLIFEGIESSGIKWKKDNVGFSNSGDIIGWNETLTKTINSVEVGHGGVYTIYRSAGNVLGIARLIVRVCSSGKYGANCTGDCPRCENGGICHDITGECICPPGFTGSICSTGCGGNRFGSDCNSNCSQAYHEDGCRGKYVCTIDPYGCSCTTGYKGVTCSEDCPYGYYGADCQQTCGHCNNNATCSPYTGHCPNACCPGYMTFPHCKLEIARLKDPAVIMSRSGQTISFLWTAWRNGTDHGVGLIEKYIVEYRQNGGGFWTSEKVTNVANQTTFTYNIFNTDVSHVYVVRIGIQVAGGLLGNSSPEVEACGEPEAPEPSLSNLAVNTIEVHWPEPNWKCSTPGWYVLEYINGTDTTWERTSSLTSRTTCTSLYTATCTTWRLRLRVFNKHMSSLSGEKNITSRNKAPSHVKGLAIETGSATSTSVTVVWKKPGSNGCPNEEYRLTYRLIKVLQCTVGHSGDEVTEILRTTRKDITGLKPNSKYEIKVAVQTESNGEENSIHIITLQDAPSSPPVNASVTHVSNTSLSFSWGKVECLRQNGQVSSYRYQIRNKMGPCVMNINSVSKTGNRDVTFLNLQPYTRYELRVQAIVGQLAGPWSGWTNVMTKQSVPTAPTNVVIVERAPGSVTVSWSSPCPPRGAIGGYMVQYRSLNESELVMTSSCNHCTKLVLQNLPYNELYEFKVKAKTIDWGDWSNSIVEKISDAKDINLSSVNESLVIGAVCGSMGFVLVFSVLGFVLSKKRRTSHRTSKSGETIEKWYEPGQSKRVPHELGCAVELSSFDVAEDKSDDNEATIAYETVANDGRTSKVYEKIEPSYWTIPLNSIVFGDVVGKGSFGDVLSATIAKDGAITKVALKRLNACATDKDRTDFIGELNILSQVGSHANVISLIGACEYEDVLYVATEYAANGNLRILLRNSRKDSEYANVGTTTSFSEKQLLQMALDVSRGMKHLAAFKIIHRDLAARNILVSEDLTAKISDFGLSRNEDIYVKQTQTRVPIRWMAPESLFNQTYSTKSDVWSFGILLWEIVTLGGTPYSGICSSDLLVMLKTNYRMSQPCNCSDDIYGLMTSCWSKAPSQRPSFNILVAMLEDMLLQRKTYISVTCGNDFLYETIDTVKDNQ